MREPSLLKLCFPLQICCQKLEVAEYTKTFGLQRWKKGEKLVNKTVDAVKSFLNPFDVPEETKFYCLSSGAATPSEIEIDVLRAETAVDRQRSSLFNLQLTIRGSGKLKQTITKLLALPGGIKNLHFQEQWGWHCADEIDKIETWFRAFPKFKLINAPHLYLTQIGVG